MSAYSLSYFPWDLWTSDLRSYRSSTSDFTAHWHRKDNTFTREVSLPGFAPENVSATLNPGSGFIDIKATRGTQTRTFSISVPDDMDENSIQAVMKDGMLTLTATTVAPVVKTIQILPGTTEQ